MKGRGHPAQSTLDVPPGWPAGVRPISLEGLNRLGVGDDGAIYWDGKPVEVRKSVTLTRWQRVGAAIVTLSAVAAAIATIASAIADWWPILHC